MSTTRVQNTQEQRSLQRMNVSYSKIIYLYKKWNRWDFSVINMNWDVKPQKERTANIYKISLSSWSLNFRNENSNILRSLRALIHLLEYVYIACRDILFFIIYQYADLWYIHFSTQLYIVEKFLHWWLVR